MMRMQKLIRILRRGSETYGTVQYNELARVAELLHDDTTRSADEIRIGRLGSPPAGPPGQDDP